MYVRIFVFLLGIVPMLYAPTYCASKHGVVGFSRSMKVNTHCILKSKEVIQTSNYFCLHLLSCIGEISCNKVVVEG